MPRTIEINLEGIDLLLLGDRGVFCDAQRTLFVADTHLGKDATFRRGGIPVPSGSTQGTLTTISGMLDQTQSTRLVVLGDLFHARSSLSSQVCESLDAFFGRHRDVRLTFVPGNHDAHLGPLPTRWPIDVIEPRTVQGGIALAHHPGQKPDSARLLMCGHLHPGIRLVSSRDQLGTVPCFWFHKACLVLPAIGEFTGMHRVSPEPNDRVWLDLDGELVAYRRRGATTPT